MIRIKETPAMVTGANRGLGRELLFELIERGCPKVYATARGAHKIAQTSRIHPVDMDITHERSVAHARVELERNGDIGLLINNAGIASPDMIDCFDTNVMGTKLVTEQMLGSLLRRSDSSRADSGIVNISTMYGLVNPGGFMTGYALSKAGVHSLTQAYRADLREKGVYVACVYAGPIDTDMTKDFDIPGKADPRLVARAILDAVERGDEYIYPDHLSRTWADTYEQAPLALEGLARS